MPRHAIIASAAYVDSEMQVEFGPLPPAFLPLGNRRLFVHQATLLRRAFDRVTLTLPAGFTPDEADGHALADLDVDVVHVPEGRSLGESLAHAIRAAAPDASPLALLYGDALFEGIDLHATDCVTALPTAPAGYRWSRVHIDGGAVAAPSPAAREAALTGYFQFADPAALVDAIERRGGDFVAGLLDYNAARPLRVLPAGRWHDFGHVGTYHRSRRSVTTQREFNQLTLDRRTVVKSGEPPRKIDAEARWFEGLPPALRLHTPAWLGRRSDGGYALEYLHLPTLAEMFVFGRLHGATWARVFEACDEFLGVCAAHPAPPDDAPVGDGLYLPKTLARLESYARAAAIDLAAPCRLDDVWLPSLEAIARACAAAIPPAPEGLRCLVHGDFCFSNIFYDARADVVRVIDPRGVDGADRPTMYGDLRYDVAKLYHSAIGRYDVILAGAYRLRSDGPLQLSLELPETAAAAAAAAAFLDRRFVGLTTAEAASLPASVLLFLSMLPLHGDDPSRQRALLANALRLYRRLDQGAAA